MDNEEYTGMDGCPICLDALNVLSDIAITSCGHLFHTNCLITACVKQTTSCQPTCPCCRQRLGVPDKPKQQQEQQGVRIVHRDVNSGQIHRDHDLPAVIDANGTQTWYWQGYIHRENDLPAMVSPSRHIKEWWIRGKRHRDNGLPAVIQQDDGFIIVRQEWWIHDHKTRLWCSNGREEWYQYSEERHANEWHRIGRPAVITREGHEKWYQEGQLHYIRYANGNQEWYQNGKLHRGAATATIQDTSDDDLPAVIKTNGTQVWYAKGKRHRLHGPAMIMANGTRKWYQHGKLHRLDGPAILNPPPGLTKDKDIDEDMDNEPDEETIEHELYYIKGKRVDPSVLLSYCES